MDTPPPLPKRKTDAEKLAALEKLRDHVLYLARVRPFQTWDASVVRTLVDFARQAQ